MRKTASSGKTVARGSKQRKRRTTVAQANFLADGKVLDSLLAVGVTLRATRLVTADWLGEWLLVDKAKRWAANRGQPPKEEMNAYVDEVIESDRLGDVIPFPPITRGWGWRAKLVKGLDCPFCVGFWIGLLALTALAVVRKVPVLRPLWRLLAGALSLNYVTGHVSARLDS